MRKILHIDMDAFFASVEQRDNPRLRGKPVVVGGRPEQRGAVAAASYEARKYGIFSATPSRVAATKCKDLIFVAPRFEVYRQVSQQIRAIFHQFTDRVEPVSLDEAYLDVTENKAQVDSAMAIAREIKRLIVQETHLTASAGVSINKFLAKMASGLEKPNGLSLVAPDQAETFVQQLPIEKFHGIGKVTAAKMHQLGIQTGTELRQWSEPSLVRQFGKVGHYYYGIARGIDQRPVVANRIRKSIGAERSFFPDISGLPVLMEELDAIATQVHLRLAENQRSGYTLTLKVKYANYQQITRSRTVDHPLFEVDEILALGKELLQVHIDAQQAVRLLGLTLANLVDKDHSPKQLSIGFV
ncbi:DNA polymerase IV [Acaryochloris sp. CCMEE 5410]|uniref:DNA polymerase IV n=1 Tax=Acaryochloris sp. CCMEE 5410 TaxID=310037 RepID=UPI0002485277|nr:DNA polymerase IV [Acaryochloris sp. CCMEE 5410]KAI9132928.1 DNA polymerase IV [Acaryochloris sp. CCMEE 5410]